ncbi:MAG: hypothetical protein QG657_3769, partial [Acidobacteriota bacterium]|nr:hypothetical protein [Acidobacteriota bacterium]
FVLDFRRIDFYDVKADESIDSFLQDSHSYIVKNIKQITVKRMQPDGKFNEAMVTEEEILKTAENSFALVPFLDSVEKERLSSGSYVYNMYLHFDVYSTKAKAKIKTLKVNNDKNLLGILSSTTGSLLVDNSDLDGLPEDVQKDEKSFRNSIAGLFAVLKKQLKEMPEFCITGELSMVNHSAFGFDMGADTGIKIDHRYKTVVSKSDGRKKMTGFGKIRKVKESYSEAQILIGRPQEGDQVIEEPKVGITIAGGFGVAPLHIDMSSGDIVSGSHKCIFLGAEYELGPITNMSEWYTAFSLRIGFPSPETYFFEHIKVSQLLFNLGVVKKIYLKRLALNFGGFIGIHGATLTYNSYNERSGSSIGFTMNAGLEFMITPSISAFGGFNLDMYPNPSKLEDEDGYKYDFPKGWDWNAKGLSMNFGVKVTM